MVERKELEDRFTRWQAQYCGGRLASATSMASGKVIYVTTNSMNLLRYIKGFFLKVFQLLQGYPNEL